MGSDRWLHYGIAGMALVCFCCGYFVGGGTLSKLLHPFRRKRSIQYLINLKDKSVVCSFEGECGNVSQEAMYQAESVTSRSRSHHVIAEGIVFFQPESKEENRD